MDLQPQLYTLNQLLNGRLFRIPDYQRAYSWTSKERRELFSDLLKLNEKLSAKPELSHFMATVVGLRRDTQMIRADQFRLIDVVDGQQRLTTLVILLKALEQQMAAQNIDPATQADLKSLLVKTNDVSTVLLQTNHDTTQYCTTYLREGTHPDTEVATTVADRRLLEAIEDCQRFVTEWTEAGRDALELVALVKNRLQFIFHEITDESLVYTVFEVLNSRGLDVSWFDRLKSALMAIAFEAEPGGPQDCIDELHLVWGQIYACVGLHQDRSTEAMRFAATLRTDTKPNRTLGEEDAVEELRRQSKATASGAISVSNWLLRVTKAVDQLLSNSRLDAVTEIAQARLLAVAILLRDDFSDEDRQSLLRSWEKVSFRIYGMSRRDSRTKVGDYVRLAWECEHNRPTVQALAESIKALGSSFPIETALGELRDKDCYEGWQAELRYLLYRYEEYLVRNQRGAQFANAHWQHIWSVTPARSIEHIYPKSKGSETPTKFGIFVHRLGNLVILPPDWNSRLGNKDPKQKAKEYVDTGLAVALDAARRMSAWNRAAIVERENELLAWAATEWSD